MQEGYTLTVCGVLVGRAACAEDKLFWWLERELENKIKHRSKQHKFFSQKQDLPGLAIIKVNPIPEIAWLESDFMPLDFCGKYSYWSKVTYMASINHNLF